MVAKDNKKTLVLLDVHAIIHRAYHALPEFATSKGEPTGALYGLSTMLLKIISDLKPDYIIACYDLPKPTYRHEAYKEYKAGRAKTDDELVSQLKKSYEIFSAFNIPVYHKEGFEADDIIGTIVEETKKNKELNVVIASGDMDTLQLTEEGRVRVYTLKKGIKDTIIYDKKMVEERFGFDSTLLPDFKGLRGDASDNIIGIKGIGEKTATELIQKFGTIEEIYKVIKKDRKKLLDAGIKERIVALLEEGEEEANFSKMLGTIRKDAPIDFTIPEKRWSEAIDTDLINKVWADLEFRTLSARLRDVLGRKSEVVELKSDIDENSQKVKELEIMLWLINSNVTTPTVEDLINFTGEKDLNKIEQKILSDLEDRNLKLVWEEIEKPLMDILVEMKEHGVKIDKAELQLLSSTYHKELDLLEKKIWEYAGTEFNVSSPKQLGEILFVRLGLKPKNQKKTGSGALSTKESELEKMRDMHPIVPLIFEYREFQKLLSTYIDVIPTLLDKDDKLHAKFLQAGTTTGRMSSSDPNLQNIPNKSELGRNIRKAFITEPGYKLVSFDYSQIELRIAAILSKDEKMLEIFKNGEDVHTGVASRVFGVSPDKVDKEMRRKAKVINFGIMYGMGVNSLRQNLSQGAPEVTKQEAQKFYDEYFANFSGLARYLNDTKADAERKGFTETIFGRRRYFEGLKSKLPFVKAMAERMAINAPIQGTEADIIKLAMIKVYEFIKKEALENDVKVILQVHDELVYEIKEDKVAEMAKEIKKIMETVLPEEKSLGVKCLTECSVGDNWMEMEKLKLD